MLTLDYIEQNTLWVAKFRSHRKIDTYDKLKPFLNDEELRDIDTVYWKEQPKELQEFYKAYEYALYDLRRHDLYKIKDFYEEWVKNPKQFTPEYKPVIGKLSEMIESLDPCDDLIISNYYGIEGAGNHHVGNFIETLQILGVDFDVVSFEEGNPNKISIQTDDLELLREFSSKANSVAISHDKYMGDGKYWRED